MSEHPMTVYDIPDEIQVEADGPLRIVRLNRPDALNATNHVLHSGLAGLWPQIDADLDARAVVLTGNGPDGVKRSSRSPVSASPAAPGRGSTSREPASSGVMASCSSSTDAGSSGRSKTIAMDVVTAMPSTPSAGTTVTTSSPARAVVKASSRASSSAVPARSVAVVSISRR